MNHNLPIEKFKQKLCDVIGPLPRLWKWLEAINRKGPEETVSVPIKEYIQLVKQSVLSLGQASNTKMYRSWLNILKPPDEGP